MAARPSHHPTAAGNTNVTAHEPGPAAGRTKVTAHEPGPAAGNTNVTAHEREPAACARARARSARTSASPQRAADGARQSG
jgi:hypothetical protein